MTEQATRKPRAWTADFLATKDSLAAAIGCDVRWIQEDGELWARADDGPELLAGGLETKRDAYWWMRGRLAGEAER